MGDGGEGLCVCVWGGGGQPPFEPLPTFLFIECPYKVVQQCVQKSM